jgi:hypothetical protein
MPCFYEDFRTDDQKHRDRIREQEYRRLVLVLDELHGNGYAVRVYKTTRDLDAMTQDACKSMRHLEALSKSAGYASVLSNKSPELRTWWDDHKKKDAERERREQDDKRKAELVQSALSKLTYDERIALGFSE